MSKKLALISVFVKDGITEFAQQLIDLGFEIISSGNTAKHLIADGVSVTDVAVFVGGEAILGHRVVTLSREIHAGLLAQYNKDEAEMEKLGLRYIDLVCCNLYPLQEEIAKPDCTTESVINMTDIGGPTLLRSAAKGRRIVIGDVGDQQPTIDWLKTGCPNEVEYRNNLAAKAEFIVSQYCLLSARFHSAGKYNGFFGKESAACKYGENAYQSPAALYTNDLKDPFSLGNFKLVAGMPLSYNNYCDLDRLLQTMTHIAAAFDLNRSCFPHIALGVKHGNTCGAAVSKDQTIAIKNMISGDPQSLFGGLVMVNFSVNEEIAELLLTYRTEKRRVLDAIIAPEFSPEAIELLKRKGDKCRFVVNHNLAHLTYFSLDPKPIFRYVRGGYLLQPNYLSVLNLDDPDLKKYYGEASETKENDILLARAICNTSNSNTITIVHNGRLIANGVGQQSRVKGAKLAVTMATDNDNGYDLSGAVAASDSFFPFTDGVEVLANAGIKTIISTSGSVKDKEVINFCQQNGIVLYLIPDAKGRGFFNH